MKEKENKSVFDVLSAVNCNNHTETKNGLTYLSWAWAWFAIKTYYPEATYTIYENQQGLNYFTDGRTCWVKTGVTINGIENIEYLPVMDFKNKSIPADTVTSFDVNKAIQRSLTKACARHGLGLYIYAGEDLPEAVKIEQKNKAEQDKIEQQKKAEQEKIEQQNKFNALLATIGTCTTSAEVTKIWQENIPLQKNKDFVAAIKARGSELKAKEGAA